MDANKLVKLKVIQYRVLKTCGNCVHGKNISPSGWGTCGLHTYSHLKHTDEQRQLSIDRAGTCTSWDNPLFAGSLGGFAELIEGA